MKVPISLILNSHWFMLMEMENVPDRSESITVSAGMKVQKAIW